MECRVCKSKHPKYKCPSCLTAYCSVSCWKDHKAGQCELQDAPRSEQTDSVEVSAVPHYNYTTQDTVPIDKLKLLGNSEGLQRILQNPHVRDMLVAIDNAREPEEAIRVAMLEPIFVEFADECLKVVEPLESPP